MVGLGWLVSKPLVGTADGQNRRKTKRRQPTSPRRVRRFAASLASSSCLPRRNAAIKSWHHYLTGFPSFSSLSGDLFAHRIHFPMGDGGATDVGCLALLSLFVMIFPSTLSIRGPWLCSMINFLRPTVLRACTLTHLAYDSTRPFMWWMNVTCATATCGNACPPFAFIPPGGWCQNTPVFVEDDGFLGSGFLGSFSSFLFFRSNSKLQCRRCQKTSDRSLIPVGRRDVLNFASVNFFGRRRQRLFYGTPFLRVDCKSCSSVRVDGVVHSQTGFHFLFILRSLFASSLSKQLGVTTSVMAFSN